MSERRLPPRPTIPAALYALVAALVCERAVLSWAYRGPVLDIVMWRWVAAGLVVAAIACFAGVRLRAPAGLVTTAAALVAAVGVSMACVARAQAFVGYASHTTASKLTFVILGDSTTTERGYRSRARASCVGQASGEVWLETSEPLSLGERISCIGSFRSLPEGDWGASSWSQGVWGIVRAVRLTSRGQGAGPLGALRVLRERVVKCIAADRDIGRATLAGLICGNRSALDNLGATDAFSRCGVAHLIAVSGAHLAIVSHLVSRALAKTRTGPRIRCIVLAVVSGVFVLFCGMPVSAVRAWVMAVVASGSQLVGRRNHAVSSVSVVGLVMALVDPTLSGRLSFILSLGSVTGLALFAGYANYALAALFPLPPLPRGTSDELRHTVRRVLDSVRSLLAATLVCQLVTLPLVIATFGQVSLVAPVANVVLGPLVTLLMSIGALVFVLAALSLPLGAVLALYDLIALPFVRLLALIGGVPFAAMPLDEAVAPRVGILVMVGLGVLLVLWPRVVRRKAWRVVAVGMSLVVCLVVRWRFASPARVVVLDVGQGDAILVQEGAHALLVDTGPDDAVVRALAREHVLHLDAVLLTHLHDDHYGGVEELASGMRVDEVIVARGVRAHIPSELEASVEELCGGKVCEVAYGDSLHVGSFRLSMVWPRDVVRGDENADSIELLLRYTKQGKELSCLLTGDAERDELASILSSGDVGDIDVLKVGHHGSSVSLTYEQALALDPEVAVASAGVDNDYGHPAEECVKALEDAGSLFLCTKDVGDVTIQPGDSGPVVRCAR